MMPRRLEARIKSGRTEIKSKFGQDIHRFSIPTQSNMSFEEFNNILELKHGLKSIPYFITYVNNKGEVLPINNDENLYHAIISTGPLLRLFVKKKGQSLYEINGFGSQEKLNFFSRFISDLEFKGSKSDISEPPRNPRHVIIGAPSNFRPVSAIIDVDILPHTQRRVKLMKGAMEDKPLGFFIRDGIVWKSGEPPEKTRGVFISKLISGGLAQGTGLLAVNDEIIEVNGIDVSGKTLDQVTDMMVANAQCLILTIKPASLPGNMRTLEINQTNKPSLLQKIELSDEEDDSLTDYLSQTNAETLKARGKDTSMEDTIIHSHSFRFNGHDRRSNVNSVNSDSGIFSADTDLHNHRELNNTSITNQTYTINEAIDPLIVERKNGDGCYDDDDMQPNRLMLASWKDVHCENLATVTPKSNGQLNLNLSQDKFSRNIRNNVSDQYLHQKAKHFGFAPRASDLAIGKYSSGDKDTLLKNENFGYL